MGKDRLFQEARHFVDEALTNGTPKAKEIAKNALSSAYANSTFAQQEQLREMQDQIDRLS